MEKNVLRSSKTTRPPAPESEAVLVGKARGGDLAAFDELVRAHYERIYATAYHLVGNHEDAEDLAQECFVKAHGALRWYRGEGTFLGWLRRILVHLVRDRYRRDSRRPTSAPLAESEGPIVRRSPLAEVKGRELQLLVAEGLRRLPDHLRIALVLRTLDGLDYEDVSRATGVTAATARTQVMKARRALRRILEPHLEEGEQ